MTMSDKIEDKKCILCGKGSPEVSFYTNSIYPYGVPRCKKCCKEHRQKRKIVQEGNLWCSVCEEEFPATTDYFYSSPHRRKGLHTICISCSKKRDTGYYAKAKEHLEERKEGKPDTWVCRACQTEKLFDEEHFSIQPRCYYGLRTTCKECESVTRREYDQEHREERKIYIEQYTKEHKGQRSLYFRERYQQRKKEILAQQQTFKITYPETVHGWKQRYAKSPRGRITHRINSSQRRAREKGIEGSYTREDIQSQYKRQKGKCYWCGIKLQKFHIDHIIPITRPGSTNWLYNLVLSCGPCNTSRQNKLPHEWPRGNHLL